MGTSKPASSSWAPRAMWSCWCSTRQWWHGCPPQRSVSSTRSARRCAGGTFAPSAPTSSGAIPGMAAIDISIPLEQLASHLDDVLRTNEIPDYPGAFNGVQVDHEGPVTRCAVAVDASLRTIDGAIAAGANMLVVHHGLFWGGTQPLRGHVYRRFQRLLAHDIAVYSAHLP